MLKNRRSTSLCQNQGLPNSCSVRHRPEQGSEQGVKSHSWKSASWGGLPSWNKHLLHHSKATTTTFKYISETCSSCHTLMFKTTAWLLSVKTTISPTHTGSWGSCSTHTHSYTSHLHLLIDVFPLRAAIPASCHSRSCPLAQLPLCTSPPDLPPSAYLNGFSPVCVRMCFLRSLCVVKYLLQPSDSQLNVFPVWSLWCAFNLKCKPQKSLLRLAGRDGPWGKKATHSNTQDRIKGWMCLEEKVSHSWK